MLLANLSFERKLQEDMSVFYADPYSYVMYAFPWGVKGTLLEEEEGPDQWQCDGLEAICEDITNNPYDAVRHATSSGHGVGKTAMVAWIVLWAMSTRPHLSGVVTANTFSQLNTKTWRELAVWHKLAINRHWFEWTAKKFCHVDHPETWFVAAEPNSEKNSEAFAGRHAKYVVQIYDEASAIPDPIWEVSEGATTTDRSIWLTYGNPTRNTGRFKSCFTTDAKRWRTRKVDSRTSKLTNKKLLEEWRESYGEDSDFFKVRVLGEFPRTTTMQFIAEADVETAIARKLPFEAYGLQPLVMGVDIARGGDEEGPLGDYGGDENVIVMRRGKKVTYLESFPGRGNLMHVVRKIQEVIKEHKPSNVFVDEAGLGYGVVDRLRELGYQIIGVNARKDPDDLKVYYDKRIEMWDRLRKWLYDADLPDDTKLKQELITPQFGHTTLRKRGELLILEKKKHTRSELGRSPDRADALAHTFYYEIASRSALSADNYDEGYYEPDEADL